MEQTRVTRHLLAFPVQGTAVQLSSSPPGRLRVIDGSSCEVEGSSTDCRVTYISGGAIREPEFFASDCRLLDDKDQRAGHTAKQARGGQHGRGESGSAAFVSLLGGGA